jgi:predicted nucleotidyltransferase
MVFWLSGFSRSFSKNGSSHQPAKLSLHKRAFCVMICNMSVAELPIQIDREKIAEFCRTRGIRKLSLFGSVLRDDFDPERSDVDVLAEFEPDALKGVGFRYFGCGEELAAILGRKVDFCSRLNKHIEATVRQEAIPIYERT